MPPPRSFTAPQRSSPTLPRRLFGRWWRRQSPAQQDRFATLGPLVSVLLFLAAIISAFWYLRNEEFEREQESVKRDTEIAQQQVRLRLIESQEQLIRVARDIATRSTTPSGFAQQAATLARERPEITHILWVNAQRVRKASYSSANLHTQVESSEEELVRSMPLPGRDGAPERAFEITSQLRYP